MPFEGSTLASWPAAVLLAGYGVMEYVRRERNHRSNLHAHSASGKEPSGRAGPQAPGVMLSSIVAVVLVVAIAWFLENDMHIPGWLDVSSSTIAGSLSVILLNVLLILYRDLMSLTGTKRR